MREPIFVAGQECFVTASVGNVTASGNLGGFAAGNDTTLFDMLSVTPAAIIGNGTTTAALTWTFNSGAQAFNHLADRETLTLAYNLPKQWVSAIPKVRSARLSVSGRNLLAFTSYSGLDPEVSNFGNQAIARNIDVAPFPPSRSFWTSLDVGF